MSRDDGTEIPSEGTVSTKTKASQLGPEVRDSKVSDFFARDIHRNGGGIFNRWTWTHDVNHGQGPSLP